MGECGLDGYFRERGLPVGVQERLEGFHQGCIDSFSRKFVPKWDSPKSENVGGTYRRGRVALCGLDL